MARQQRRAVRRAGTNMVGGGEDWQNRGGVEPPAPLLRTRLLSQPSYGPRLKGVCQLSWSTEDATTLYAVIGRRRPLSSNSPTGSTVIALSTASMTRGLIRIWPVLASSQRGNATLETVPIPAYPRQPSNPIAPSVANPWPIPPPNPMPGPTKPHLSF